MTDFHYADKVEVMVKNDRWHPYKVDQIVGGLWGSITFVLDGDDNPGQFPAQFTVRFR